MPVSPRRVRRAAHDPGLPTTSIRFHCAAGLLPPGAWPVAATPDDRYLPMRAVNVEKRRQMRVAVQDEFRAMLADDALEPPYPHQPLVLRNRIAHRRMVDHDDAEQALLARCVKRLRQSGGLTRTEKAGRHERRRRA